LLAPGQWRARPVHRRRHHGPRPANHRHHQRHHPGPLVQPTNPTGVFKAPTPPRKPLSISSLQLPTHSHTHTPLSPPASVLRPPSRAAVLPFASPPLLSYHPPMPDMWSVSELNRYVKQSLEMDYRLQDLRITGEISGFKAYPSGHWYFTLKDSGAQVSCVMWRGRAERSRFRPRDGDAVIAAGAITLYEVRGQYQLDVSLLQPTGEGALFQEFLRLKAQLELEGLFEPL